MTFAKAKQLIMLLPILVAISACVGDAGRKGRPLIKDFSLGGTTDDSAALCSDFFEPETTICRTQACPSNTHVADTDERAELKADYLQQKIDVNPANTEAVEAIDFILANFEVQNKICAPGSGITRPNRQVFVKNDYCACNNGVPDILNNCASFCAGKPNTNAQPILFGSVTLGPDILLNEELGSLERWCNQAITGTEGPAPRCALRVFDASNNTIDLDISIPSGANTFSANLGSLQVETPYVAQIVEVQSGSLASSDEFQLYRIPAPNNNPGPVGPLKIMPISQYTCVQWAGTVGANVTYDAMVKMYFYFPSNQEPLPIVNPNSGSSTVNIYCHDLQLYGTNDSPLFPRLELIPQHYSLWDFADTRLADVNPTDNNADINQTIIDRLQTEYNVSNPNLKVFNPLPVLTRPNTAQSSGGFFMVPWINPNTGRGFCPKQVDYNGNDPVFKILKDVVGVDTEGIFAAIKQPELLELGDGTSVQTPDAFLFIRENLLKQIWFYMENNQILIPNDVTAGQKTIHFYWPPDTQDPYTKKDYQRIFTVRGAADFANGGTNSLQIPTSITPSDKRLGCIPALN
tara:strand:+ start:31250 stop:32977 length:1728 start_codon:yes stop_codon:yes gene_type:complete